MTHLMKTCARLLALLVVPAATTACHDAYDSLFLDPDRSQTARIEYLFTQGLIDATLAEAEAIWRPAAVVLTWRRAARAADVDAPSRPDLILTVDERRTSVPEGQTALGWIRFTGPTPEPAIHLSRANAEDLMARTASLHDKPTVMQERLMGRALGRALVAGDRQRAADRKDVTLHGRQRRRLRRTAAASWKDRTHQQRHREAVRGTLKHR